MQLPATMPFRRPALTVTSLLWFALAATTAIAVYPALAPASGLALAIALLTLFVGAIVASFSLRYMRADQRRTRFFLMLGGLVAAVLAFVFSGNVVLLGVAWCASGLLLAAMIGHAQGWGEAAAAARRTRKAFLIGDGALIAALALLAWQTGSVQIEAVLAAAPTLPVPVVTVAALLLLVAAAARCALPPFAGWLLTSMTAPTPVSALMHAGLVNAGGFLLLRFAPVLEAAPVAQLAAVVIGLVAATYGIGIMMVRPDIKRSLAGSTVSQMGFMIMSCGLGAYAAALWHIIAHGLFKAWLFLGSGSSIGMRSGPAPAPLSGRSVLLISLVTVAAALILLLSGQASAGLIPLLLALATAFATLVASLGDRQPLGHKAALLALIAVLVGLHSAGLLLAGLAVGPDAGSLLPDWALILLLVAFLGLWVWQQQRVASGRGLPLRLYVHLINAGTVTLAGKGDAK